jgi:hypothetical protein
MVRDAMAILERLVSAYTIGPHAGLPMHATNWLELGAM